MTGSPAPSRLARDSLVVGLATVLSRLLGFARDVLIARLLGAGPVADAFLAALRLPNLVRRVLGEGGLNAPVVPLYLAIGREEGAPRAGAFAARAIAHLSLLLLAFVALGQVFAPWLVLGLAGGFAEAPETLALASLYTRLMLPFLLSATLAGLLAAILNAERRFAAAALLPALANALLLALLLGLLWHGVPPERAAFWLAAGVSLTGFAQLALMALALRGVAGVVPLDRAALRWSPEMTRLVRTGGAALLAASSGQVVLLVATQIASAEPGAVAALYYADRVFQLPLGFVGVAMGTVGLSALSAEGGEDDAALGPSLVLGLALAVPAAVALVALSGPIVSVLFEHGRFDARDAARTAAALAAFALGLPFAVAAKVFGQVYFARRAPRQPLRAGLASVAVAILVGLAASGAGDAALLAALAASLAFAAQAAWLVMAALRDGFWRPRPRDLAPLAAILAASLAMLAVLVALAPALAEALAPGRPFLSRLAALSALCGGGLAAYGAAAWLFGVFRVRPLR